LFVSQTTFADEASKLREAARSAILKSVEFFRTQVAVEGGYVFRVSGDLKLREGEEKVGPKTVWIEPPATPAVGMAYLEAYRASGEKELLKAAAETARCLVRGQLYSGGWSVDIHFAPEERKAQAYRVDGPLQPNARNITTLDDDKTQSCVRFLMNFDRELGFKEKSVHEATLYALDALLKFQYPNGAWPQRFSTPSDPKEFSVKQASYPESWSRVYPKQDYTGYYTLNDNTHVDTMLLMLGAYDIYGDDRYKQAAMKGGDFLLSAQMPEPQPAWAQQYNRDMQPAWARKFEPPAVTGGESQKVVETLLRLFQETGESRYADSSRKALDWLKKSVLPDGQLARFYELKTNRPLFFTKQYVPTYDDGDLPTHYGFKVKNGLAKLEERYEKLVKLSPADLKAYADRQRKNSKIEKPGESEVKKVIAALDSRGAWLESGSLSNYKDYKGQVIDSKTFIKNLGILSRSRKTADGDLRQ
jgi:hypothetical protein